MPSRSCGVTRSWLALSLLAVSMPVASVHAASLQPRAEQPDDAVRVVRAPRGAVIEITSADGIGRMIVPSPARSAWPSPLRLRLRYATGRPFGTLEGLDLSVDGKVVATREAMRVEKGRGWLEVTLPAGVTTAGKPLHVQWVDAYRR